MITTFRLFFISLLVLVTNISQAQKGLIADKAMVVSAREEASKIGVAILKKGGNAFDAMVATELALAVAYPYAGNIGGGGFMVFRKANGETGTLDYREKAPLSATKNMFLDKNGDSILTNPTNSPLVNQLGEGFWAEFFDSFIAAELETNVCSEFLFAKVTVCSHARAGTRLAQDEALRLQLVDVDFFLQR